MIDILKRIAIGIIVGMSIFFLKTEVFALETSSVQVYTSNQSGILDIVDSSSNQSNPRVYQNLTFNNNYTNSFGYDYMQFNISATLFSTSNNTSSSYNTTGIPLIMGAYIVGNDTTAYCESTFSSIKCPIKKGSTYSRITIYFSTVPKFSSGTSSAAVRYFIDQRVMVFSSEVVQGFGDSTEQQTQDILDSDSPASATYDNDYSTDDYDTAESNMNQNLDQDVSSFTFNPLSWSHSFSFIWDTVTDLVQINSKVFLMITTFLTFSFVGLVIGRS